MSYFGLAPSLNRKFIWLHITCALTLKVILYILCATHYTRLGVEFSTLLSGWHSQRFKSWSILLNRFLKNF
jgi:hypothetical protein